MFHPLRKPVMGKIREAAMAELLLETAPDSDNPPSLAVSEASTKVQTKNPAKKEAMRKLVSKLGKTFFRRYAKSSCALHIFAAISSP